MPRSGIAVSYGNSIFSFLNLLILHVTVYLLFFLFPPANHPSIPFIHFSTSSCYQKAEIKSVLPIEGHRRGFMNKIESSCVDLCIPSSVLSSQIRAYSLSGLTQAREYVTWNYISTLFTLFCGNFFFHFFFFKLINLFLFLAVLGLRCCAQAFL